MDDSSKNSSDLPEKKSKNAKLCEQQ
ncbi:uncharacterized protein G2W53_000813 [Senna tora]|uniref:Uncharacterized protein n=1 Tax=Senna tora TaxID=362788 RepID=A0A834XET4_9FABA|nr:uncharacterized protein G2W53_000813 [Senna tora]